MPPTPFSNTDDSEGATIAGSDGDGVFKNATNGSTTVGGVTPLTTNTGGGIVRIDTSSAEVGINANPARAFHVIHLRRTSAHDLRAQTPKWRWSSRIRRAPRPSNAATITDSTTAPESSLESPPPVS